MLQQEAAAELELLQEAARKYETVERARIDEVLDGLRTQGRSLREAMARTAPRPKVRDDFQENKRQPPNN